MLTTIKNLSIQRTLGHQSGAQAAPSRAALWRTPVAVAALALSLGLGALDAHALALGRVNVLSALGEPLRAEIEVPDINAEEAASLKTNVASGDAFRAAGLEFNPALSNLQISLQRRPNGNAYLRLSSDKPVNEPFVDLILETSWSTGRLVRDYTLLFDPSNMRAQSAPAISAAPSVGSSSAPSQSAPRAVAAAPYVAPPVVYAPARSSPRRAPAVTRAPVAPSAKGSPGSVTVKAGNTATQIAVRNKPAGVSLDQMLVALLENNPDAFVNGNINRLKKGAVLDIPDAGLASSTAPDQARQTITAQSKDFNEFRRRLAGSVASANTPTASRKASGTVQAKVEEKKPTAAAPDKLTLSKGAVAAASAASASAKSSKEEAIAKEKQAKDAATRTAELSKNIQDLNNLVTPTVAAPSAKPAPAPAAASSVPGIALPTVAPAPVLPKTTVTATATAALPAISTTAAVTKPVTPTAAPAVTSSAAVASPSAPVPAPNAAVSAPASATTAAVVTAKPAAPPVVPASEPSMVDSLMDNPLTLPATGGLLAALVGFGVYRMRKRKTNSQVDSSFLESRLQPDSFFGASGGQRIDTNDAGAPASGSSMVYSPSQLDAAGDVDPVAEADVYLAYGRDLQAEEILKEAMRTNPSRVAIHAKLMEIYAKRRDLKAFETVANEAYTVTKGQGTEWEAAAALGRDIDPSNPLYQSLAKPVSAAAPGKLPAAGVAGLAAAGAVAFAGRASAQPARPTEDPDVDFDLDLDFSSGDDLNNALSTTQGIHTSTSPIHVQSTVAMKPTPSLDSPAMDLAFDSPAAMDLSGTNSGLIDLSPPDLASFDQKLSFPEPKMSAPGIAPTAPMSFATAPAEPNMDALEFDLGDLSLDLPSSGTAAAANQAVDAQLSGDPLDTKLALAQEFREIGDNDGARALAQEVAAEATGALKARAQRMVADLS